MRYKDFKISDPAKELANKLPSLKKTDYDTIDELMQKISKRHKITGKKLHDLFVHKYGHTPDIWIKKIKQRNEEVNESDPKKKGDDYKIQEINKFIRWTVQKLHIKDPLPKFEFSNDTEAAQQGHHTGVHTPEDNKIWVYIGNRNLVDILRTVFHELVHERQTQLGMIKPGDNYPGSPIEAMADMLAGKYIKIYGKQHPEVFQ